MSTTFQLDTSTSRANPTPQPMKRLTVPKIRAHKADGETKDPLVMLVIARRLVRALATFLGLGSRMA